MMCDISEIMTYFAAHTYVYPVWNSYIIMSSVCAYTCSLG